MSHLLYLVRTVTDERTMLIVPICFVFSTIYRKIDKNNRWKSDRRIKDVDTHLRGCVTSRWTNVAEIEVTHV